MMPPPTITICACVSIEISRRSCLCYRPQANVPPIVAQSVLGRALRFHIVPDRRDLKFLLAALFLTKLRSDPVLSANMRFHPVYEKTLEWWPPPGDR